MKPSASASLFRVLRISLVFAISLAASSSLVSAQTIDGSLGVNMNHTGRITNAPVITIPNGTTIRWETTAALQGFMVPASQFTGLTTAGIQVNYEDLIPIKSSSISIMTGLPGAPPVGAGTIIDGNGIEANRLNVTGVTVLE